MKTAPDPPDLLSAPSSSFRLYLQTELARRCAANRQYSLRSFALQLDVDHSTLSQVLRGKRRLTPQMIKKFGRRLNLPAEGVEAFAEHEEMARSGDAVVAGKVQQLTLDAVRLLSDTRHQSILELIQLESFRPDVRWIARVLNAEPDEVNIALSRLLRLGLLEMTTAERWLDRSESLSKDRNDFAAQVIRKLSEKVRQLSATTTRSYTDVGALQPPVRIRLSKHQLDSVLELVRRLQCGAGDETPDLEDGHSYDLTINRVPDVSSGKP